MTSVSFDLQRVQRIRKLAILLFLVAAVALATVTGSFWGQGAFHEALEAFGLGAIVVAIVGRAWCSLYIGGRKKAEIVSTGPYSISRNPLYVFSYAAAFGVGAQTGSFVMAVLFVMVAVLVFHFTIAKEEAWLTEAFGQPYLDYLARTPRCGPDFSKWHDDQDILVKPEFFLTTLRDGLVFLIAVPVFGGIEMAQHAGWLPVLMHLP